MSGKRSAFGCSSSLLLVLSLVLLLPTATLAAKGSTSKQSQGQWWNVVPEEESPSGLYDSILYSEIAPRLREIELHSNRVKVEVIGQSAGGRNLFLVTVSAPGPMGRLGRYRAIRKTMLRDPEKAQALIDEFGDFKVPVLVNGSIHGHEYPGTDAAIRLIETLAYGESEEVQAILENVILLVNVVANPDGRVLGTRRNANGFDLNRDFLTQSQPETRAAARVLTEWNPMVVLDLHGFANPMLIEPTTPPHNPNYEYDLYIGWALAQAEAMEAELFAQLGEGAVIPYRDWAMGWDDWVPGYLTGYAMYHGAYGHALETPYSYELGVDAHFAAVWGALEFIAENREGMVRDQIEVFRRGFLDLPQQPIPPELLPLWDQYPDLMLQEFPAAYVIPAGAPFQLSPHQPARLVDFLLFNDVQVEQATQSFRLDGIEYPKGTYVVWTDQPKRGLANTILDDGPDLSDIPGLHFYTPPSVWSHPQLWGVELAVMEERGDIKTRAIRKADAPRGSFQGGRAGAYAYLPTSIAAFKATNELLARGVSLYRASESFADAGREFGAGTIIVANEPALANELATHYALDVFALEDRPENAIPMREQRIAVYGDEGVDHALEMLGFDHDLVSRSDLNAGVISGYDVFINLGLRWTQLDFDGRASVTDWFAAGNDYVGLGFEGRAVDFAVDAGFADVDYAPIEGNAIVEVDYDPDDSVAAGFAEDGHAFVYSGVWFSDWAGDMEISARLDGGEFLTSGFWPGWHVSGANGMPVILHGATDSSHVTLIGIDPTFRGHPENTFRILGNAIYSGLD